MVDRLRPGQWVRHRPNATKGYEFGKVLCIDADGLAAIRFYRAIRWFFADIDEFVPHEWSDDDMTTPFERRRLWYLMHPEACHGRDLCPCCGYPTLLPVRDEIVDEIQLFRKTDGSPSDPTPVAVALDSQNCPLCFWFDRGRDDESADEFDQVNNMTLADARRNFAVTQSMDPADKDSVFARALSEPIVREARNRSIVCFEKLRSDRGTPARRALWTTIEQSLQDYATRLETARERLSQK